LNDSVVLMYFSLSFCKLKQKWVERDIVKQLAMISTFTWNGCCWNENTRHGSNLAILAEMKKQPIDNRYWHFGIIAIQ
jgi:hypothetical protein